MSLDIPDTVSSAFGVLKQGHGLKLLGALILIQVLFRATMFAGGSLVMNLLAAVVVLAGLVAAFVFPIAAFRVLDSEEFSISYFTTDVAAPAVKNLGIGLVTSVLAYLPAYLLMIPLLLAGVGLVGPSSLGAAGMGAAGIFSELSAPLIAVGVLSFFLGLTWIVYAYLSLILSIPYLAVEGTRLFESMDESVQTAIGNRFAMFAALLPLIVLYIAYAAGSAALPISETVIGPIYSVLFSSLLGVAGASYVNEFYQRL